ncbi:MAG: pyridine nucleotide-disulfide oxidoreductase/dicluster-binding protein, partial [Acidobacteriota bacterium]
MDQQELRDWENRCIQEEPPYCQAACPIHVDVRAFMAQMKAGNADAARKILEKSMPLPGVLGSICDHPCEMVCKRREAGEPLAIGALERACVRLGRPGPKPLVLPAKGKKAAALGGGLASLTCAWDLARKGFSVTVLTPEGHVGGRLAALPEHELPAAELKRELERLQGMGVELLTGQDFSPQALDAVLADFDAVFAEYGTPLCPPGREEADPVTLSAGLEKVFCGGWPGPDGKPSPIAEAADGRRAGASMDRAMSGASLTASREKEGPIPTRLFTSLMGIEPALRVAPAGEHGLYGAPDSAAEAARCLDCQCLECVKVCAYLEHYKGYPKKYARQIYNNAAIVQGVHQANTMIDSCMLCGLCTEVCPERFSMADFCLEARRDMVERGKMPPSAHEFALEDMAFNNGPAFRLALSEPGTLTSAYAFFPGCQLAASHPHHAASTYAFLRSRLSGGVGLMLRCCAIPAKWAAREDLFAQASEELLADWRSLGSPEVITACSSCLAVFKEHLPELKARSIWEVFAESGAPKPIGIKPEGAVALHDPCTLRHDATAREAVRTVLRGAGVP